MTQPSSIMWFRQDLRLADNPALTHAIKQGEVLAVYIDDDTNPGDFEMGAVTKWWLHHSLKALDESLDGKLNIYQGDPLETLKALVQQFGVTHLSWNRMYEAWAIERDKAIKLHFQEGGIEVETFNGSLLWEPWDVLKKDGTPYRVFTPFYRKGCLSAKPPRMPLGKPKKLVAHGDPKSIAIDELNLLPSHPWHHKLEPYWKIGEQAAKKKMQSYLKAKVDQYKKARDFPGMEATSSLSPHLHFGEVSPNQVWYGAKDGEWSDGRDVFCSELGWREFSYSLLFYNPKLPTDNLMEKFNDFPWKQNKKFLKAWQFGNTGIPIVDAGMRQLYETGHMHNRLRMIVGSFLVKNLLLHWHHGERWFWDCLVDADMAANSASWQWVAGCGADASPYFRVFNPTLQGEKFDPNGEFTKKFVPELKDLPKKYLFCPWEAPDVILKEAGVTLGKTYPKPIVDLKASRLEALSAYETIKSSS